MLHAFVPGLGGIRSISSKSQLADRSGSRFESGRTDREKKHVVVVGGGVGGFAREDRLDKPNELLMRLGIPISFMIRSAKTKAYNPKLDNVVGIDALKTWNLTILARL